MNIHRFTATGFNPNNRCAEVAADDHGAWVLHDDVADMQRDAERYRWLRERWGRISETYEAGTPTMTEIGDEPDGWDTDGESLDRCIDAAMAGANSGINRSRSHRTQVPRHYEAVSG